MATPFLWESLDHFKSSAAPHDWPSNVKRFWSPDDDVHSALKTVISSAVSTIDCAMYGWDDDELDTLFREKWLDEKIAVKICLDKSQAGGVHERELISKWNQLGANNLPFVVGQSRKHAISHLKLCVVDGLYTIQGSTNWSASGETKQNNECTIIMDRAVAQDAIWKISLTYTEMMKQSVK